MDGKARLVELRRCANCLKFLKLSAIKPIIYWAVLLVKFKQVINKDKNIFVDLKQLNIAY